MRQIFCDSRDRVSGTTTDFTIQLPETLTLPSGRRARVDNLRIPLVIPTIHDTNNTIQILIGSTLYTVTLLMGSFDGAGLAAMIQGRLTATAPGAWTCVYDNSLISLSISCSNPFTITGGSYAAQIMSHPYAQTANSYKFSYVSVLGIDMFDLSSQTVATMDTIGPQGAHDTLMCAIVTSPFGSVLDVSMPADVWVTLPADNAANLVSAA